MHRRERWTPVAGLVHTWQVTWPEWFKQGVNPFAWCTSAGRASGTRGVEAENRCSVCAGAGGFCGQLHAAAAATAPRQPPPSVSALDVPLNSKAPPTVKMNPNRETDRRQQQNIKGHIHSALVFQCLQYISWKKLYVHEYSKNHQEQQTILILICLSGNSNLNLSAADFGLHFVLQFYKNRIDTNRI